MVVYPGGQCRGSTPLQEIETSGAAGRPALSENRMHDESKGCPFYRDCDLPFPARETSLSLDVLQPSDCPKGPVKYLKDYQTSLMTEDLYRAQPLLAHPTTGNGAPIPWKLMDKPAPLEVPRSRAKTHYPEVQLGRPRDLALTTSDIEGCQPERTGGNCEGRTRLDKPVDPINPCYKLAGSTAEPEPSPRASGRCSLDVTDIEGAFPKPPIPFRSQYSETMRVDDEFKSRRHAKALAELAGRSLGLVAPSAPGEDTSTPRRTALTPRREGPQRSDRQTDPLNPRYRVPLQRDAPGTSLCCRWAEEQRFLGANIHVESGEIGHIPRSVPTATSHRDKDEIYFNLETRDVIGAQSQRRIGALPYSMYGPYGNRREWNASLDTRDLKGAQADTLARYPKVSSLNSARSHPCSEEDSARGRLLRACPEKI